MEVKLGYKQSEVGVIPIEWKLVKLDDNFNLKARIGWQGLTTKEYLESGTYSLVTGTDFNDGYIAWDSCVFVEKMRYDQDRNIQLRVGDVLVTKDGTIGKVAYIDNLPNPTTLNSGVFVVRPKNSEIDNRFFYAVLMSFYFDEFLNKITAGSTITHLYQKDFIHFNFILPNINEQKAIADALFDMDALISHMEKLIEKKKAIKQGALQKLLKPRDGWVTRKLGDIGEVKMCNRIFSNQTKAHGDIPFFKIGTFGSEPDAYISNELYTMFKKRFSFPNKGDILISAAGTIGRTVVYNGEPSYFQDSNIVWIDNNQNLITNQFLFYILQIVKFNTEGGTIQRLYNSILRSTEFYCPQKEEQNRIVDILSDMDGEIANFENNLEKYKKVKQGMIRDLLTGKIRLVS